MLQEPPHPRPLSPKGARGRLILLPSPPWGRGWLDEASLSAEVRRVRGSHLLSILRWDTTLGGTRPSALEGRKLNGRGQGHVLGARRPRLTIPFSPRPWRGRMFRADVATLPTGDPASVGYSTLSGSVRPWEAYRGRRAPRTCPCPRLLNANPFGVGDQSQPPCPAKDVGKDQLIQRGGALGDEVVIRSTVLNLSRQSREGGACSVGPRSRRRAQAASAPGLGAIATLGAVREPSALGPSRPATYGPWRQRGVKRSLNKQNRFTRRRKVAEGAKMTMKLLFESLGVFA